jgi:membrane-bound lytic murein transglycosylase D
MPEYLFTEVDTLHLCRETHFGQIAAVTGLEVEGIEALNPSLKRHMVPNSKVCTHVYLPVAAIGAFLANADSLYHQPALSPQVVSTYTAPLVEVHTVRSGEALGIIAQRYGVSVTKIKEWNNLRSNDIRIGQKLEIHDARNKQSTAIAAQKTSSKSTSIADKQAVALSNASDRFHVVRSGDTLWDIAKEYPGVSANDIIKANSDVSSNSLKPGQKLRIPHST